MILKMTSWILKNSCIKAHNFENEVENFKKSHIKVHNFQNEFHNFENFMCKGPWFSKWGPEFLKIPTWRSTIFKRRSRTWEKSCVKVHDFQNEVQHFKKSRVTVHDFQNEVQTFFLNSHAKGHDFQNEVQNFEKSRVEVHDFQNEVQNLKKITHKGPRLSKWGPEFSKIHG
jgi:hypothetical protein